MRLSDVAEYNRRTHGEYESLYFEGRAYTNVEIQRDSRRLAHGLVSLGLSRGDIVICHMPNCPELGVLYGALAAAGLVICPTLFLLNEREMSHIMEHSGAKAVVTSAEFLDKIKQASRAVEGARHIVSTGDAAGATPWDDLLKGRPDDFPAADVDENEMAVLLYTSGTTGTPKGVMLSGNNIYFDALAAVRTNNVARGEVALSALPMSHAYGLTTAFASMIAGTRGILQRWFNAAEVLDLTERFGVNTVVGVPAMYALLCREPDAAKRNVSSWKRLQAGGAPCPADLHDLFEKTFGLPLLEGYGLSEAAPIVSSNRPGESRRGSVGKPLEGIQVAAMDDGGRPLPAMETGEICVKGPNVMLGYYKMPGETSRAFLDGWLRTGDVGYIDGDGFIYILERKKDMIIRGGFNVLPAEVEEVLLSHPAVGEAAVVGVPDEVYGEEIKAFVVLRPGASVSGPEIMEYAKGSLAAYKRPRSVEFLDRLPRNVLGKVLKKDLPRR